MWEIVNRLVEVMAKGKMGEALGEIIY